MALIGLMVHRDVGYLCVPCLAQMNAAKAIDAFLPGCSLAFVKKSALWLVNRELFYPEVGLVLGCFAKSRALFYVGLESDTLVQEALHEAGHPWDWSIACISAS